MVGDLPPQSHNQSLLASIRRSMKVFDTISVHIVYFQYTKRCSVKSNVRRQHIDLRECKLSLAIHFVYNMICC